MKNRRIFTIFGAVLGCALALVACRAEEQGRITRYQPGVYLGKKDTQLSEANKEDLKLRASGQTDTNYPTAGGGIGGGKVSKGNVDVDALGARVQQQGTGGKP